MYDETDGAIVTNPAGYTQWVIARDNTLWINPRHLNYFSEIKRGTGIKSGRHDDYKKRIVGALLPDDSILRDIKFDACPHVASLKKRFEQGKPWEETGYAQLYETFYAHPKRRELAGDSWEEFKKKKLLFWNEIYLDIKENGYKPAKKVKDNIEIAIRSTGEALIIDGRHRLFFAKNLELESVPVSVNVVSDRLPRKAKVLPDLEKLISDFSTLNQDAQKSE